MSTYELFPFAVTMPLGSVGLDLTLAYHPFTAVYSNASLVLLIALSIDCFCNVKRQGCYERCFSPQWSNCF